MATFYEQRMFRLFERYDLPNNMPMLLKMLDDYKRGICDEESLGRLIRLSPTNRSALINTMLKCANIMKETPKESKHCVSVISMCGEMLEIAAKPPKEVGFHYFMKLPREVRDRVYYFYLGHSVGSGAVIPKSKRSHCPCAPHNAPQYDTYEPINMNLMLASKTIGQEVLINFYNNRLIHFACACEMGYRLRRSETLKSLIRKVKFHWVGRYADYGIQELQDMPNLEDLVIEVSKVTGLYITERDKMIRDYFGPKRVSNNALFETVGFDDLLKIRGVKTVMVEHADRRKADRRTEAELAALESILIDHVTLDRDMVGANNN
ncbi:hypothetical protein GGS21DRAFT_196273 [Xylaria nigripes]|nr:hypothetical protein GGS21DRAFT_196273 [Xylaria nigripes]